MADGDPVERVVALAEGFINSRCVHVAAHFGIADVVGDSPRGVEAIAADAGVDTEALGRVLRHLVSLGIFEMDGAGLSHNEASRVLRSDHPDGALGLARLLGLPIVWDSFKFLDEAVMSGRPGAAFVDPGGFFAYLDSHPQESRTYDEGMTAMTVRRITRTVPHYDFAGFDVIADVGGGRGHLLKAVLDQTPGATGILFDRPQVLGSVAPDDRIEVRPGDFFVDPLPAADCYLLSNIIHDWGDPEATAILSAVRAGSPPDGTLLLFEFVVPDEGVFDASDIDISMLALVSGRERTLGEYADLLAAGGWELSRSVATPSQTIIEAKAA